MDEIINPVYSHYSVIEARHCKVTMPEAARVKRICLRRDSNPRHTAHCADALPAEPLRQPSWAGHNVP